MKYFSIFLIFLLFAGCSEVDQEVMLNEKSDLEMGKIGKVHNEGLSYILQNLKSENVNSKTAYYKASFLTKEFVAEMYGDEPDFLNNIDSAVDLELNRIERQYSYRYRIAENQDIGLLSSECQDYLAQIYSGLDKLDIEPDEYLKEIESIRQRSKDLPDEFEVFIIDSTIEILLASFQYWEENLDEWSSMSNSKLNGKISVSGLVGADAVGATTTAVNMAVNGTGAALIALGPSGWVGAGAAVAAGGLMSSAGKAIWDLWTN